MTEERRAGDWSFPEADFLGCRLSPVGVPDLLAAVDRAVRERRPLLHAVLNAAKVVHATRDEGFRHLLNSFDLIQADGMSIVWAARLIQGRRVPRLAGADLMPLLLAHAERRGYRVYFLGATDEILALMQERLLRRFPALRVAGARNGYFAPGVESEVAGQIVEARADLLFVGMPTPRKETFLATYGRDLGLGFAMGVGGTFDVLAGRVRRAPVMIQKVGMEWAWRLGQEPGRLGRRYLASNGRFVLLVLRARLPRRPHRAVEN